METIMRYPYSGFKIIEAPVAKPIVSTRFLDLLNEAVEHVSLSKSDYKKTKVCIGIIKRYLDEYSIREVVPDERFFILLREKLYAGFKSARNKPYKTDVCRQVIICVRKLINSYFLQKGITKRELIHELAFKKYERILRLSKRTQDAISWYEQEGKHIQSEKVLVQSSDGQPSIREIHRITRKLLSSTVRNKRIERALTLLTYCGKNGLEDIDKDDLESFRTREVKGGKDAAEKDLFELVSFFVNIKEAGFIDSNPLVYFKIKPIIARARKDFIGKEGIEKLMDLTTLDFNDPFDVRNRAICLLLYDTAMRAGEALLLKCSDIAKEEDSMVRITLRPEIQKGNKDTATMYFYFDQTKKVLDRYKSKIRKKFNPKCDYLFISENGSVLSRSRFLVVVRAYCDKLGIRTYYDKTPIPHIFRHSFATLNIQPLPSGLGLPLEAIVERLRHSDYKTAKKHYIHDNPYLKKIKHIAYQKQNNGDSPLDVLSVNEIKAWLAKMSVPKATINIVLKYHQNFVDKDKKDVVNYIPEDDAWDRIKHLNITIRALRKHCSLEKGLCKISQAKEYSYREDHITDLSRNWFTKEEVMKRTRRSRTTFYLDTEKFGWTTKTVGNVLLIKKSDLIE